MAHEVPAVDALCLLNDTELYHQRVEEALEWSRLVLLAWELP